MSNMNLLIIVLGLIGLAVTIILGIFVILHRDKVWESVTNGLDDLKNGLVRMTSATFATLTRPFTTVWRGVASTTTRLRSSVTRYVAKFKNSLGRMTTSALRKLKATITWPFKAFAWPFKMAWKGFKGATSRLKPMKTSGEMTKRIADIIIPAIVLGTIWKTDLFNQIPTWSPTQQFIIGILPSGAICALVASWFLAQHDICFTVLSEGEAKIVVRGGKKIKDSNGKYTGEVTGEYVRTIFAFKGYCEAPADSTNPTSKDGYYKGDLIPCATSPTYRMLWARLITWPFEYLGIRWFGLSPFYRIKFYKFEWVTIRTAQNGETTMGPKTEIIGHVLIKDAVYGHLVNDAETSEKAPMAVKYILTLRVRNPRKALFEVHRWLDAVEYITGSVVRTWVANLSYENLLKTEGVKFEEALRVTENDLRFKYGVDFRGSQILSIDPSSDKAKDLRDTTLEQFFADTKGQAEVTRADYTGQSRERLAAATQKEMEAEAAGLQAMTTAMGGGKFGAAMAAAVKASENIGGRKEEA